MALAIGSIMAVVAVLLSHMERKDEVNIIPKMSLGKQFNLRFKHSFSTLSLRQSAFKDYLLLTKDTGRRKH